MTSKTIFKIDKNSSIIILSALAVLFCLLSNITYANNILSFVVVIVKAGVFVAIPCLLFFLEKNNKDLKKLSGIMASYFSINLIVTLIASVSMVDGKIPIIWKLSFDLVNLVILISFILIIVESLLKYAGIDSKFYFMVIMKLVYLVGNTVSYPFFRIVEKKKKE